MYPCSWVGSLNIIKMFILLKVIYKFNTISTKMLIRNFTEIKKMLKFIWNVRGSQIARTILGRNRVSVITLSNLIFNILQIYSIQTG
jgi:hypothetical protein